MAKPVTRRKIQKDRLDAACKRVGIANINQLIQRLSSRSRHPYEWGTDTGNAPSLDNLIDLCELLGCSPQYLLGETDQAARRRYMTEFEHLGWATEAAYLTGRWSGSMADKIELAPEFEARREDSDAAPEPPPVSAARRREDR